MKKAVLLRLGAVLFLALAVSGVVSYFGMGNKLLEDNRKNLLHIVHILEYTLQGKSDLQKECRQIKAWLKEEALRFTVIDTDGNVLADTEEEYFDTMENHLEREEIRAALAGEVGYAIRYSETLGKQMLYVAALSADGRYVIRAAASYSGIKDYMWSVIPMLLVGAGAAAVIVVGVSVRFANTIAGPLSEISEELQKIHTDKWDFHFRKYPYRELNIISEATTRLSGEVQEQIARLEFEKKVRQEFFDNASHELKTPITAIRGYAELLANGFVTEEEKKTEFIGRILKSTEQMTQLIEDILMISRLETKDAEVTYSMIRLDALAEDILEEAGSIAECCSVRLCSECMPVTIEGSVKQMRELLMNLIINGISYNHPGGHVWVSVKESGQDVLIRVRDDGMGIREEEQTRIFERFYRVDKGRSRKLGGTGLGLSIVKHIVEFNEGSLELQSAVGEGSEFSIRLPLERAEKTDYVKGQG